MPKWLVVVFAAVFQAVLKRCTPMIREAIENFLISLEKKAKETPNVFDDMIVDLLQAIFRVQEDG